MANCAPQTLDGGALDAAIDRHNFETIAAGTRLGWIAPGTPWPLRAVDERGADRSTALFVADSGELRTRIAVVPIMMTTDVAVARSDCLFYAVRQRRRTRHLSPQSGRW